MPTRAASVVLVGMVGVAICGAACTKDPTATSTYAPPKHDRAKLTVMKYAFEAYPSWEMTHPASACPKSLDDLAEYMAPGDAVDPWGNRYRMMCGAELPLGARGLAVMSLGEDGAAGTADDVTSWDTVPSTTSTTGMGRAVRDAGAALQIVTEPHGALPASCMRYKAAIDRLATCDKLPAEARQAMKQAFDQASASWVNLPAEALPALGTACKAGLDAIEQSVTGCP